MLTLKVEKELYDKLLSGEVTELYYKINAVNAMRFKGLLTYHPMHVHVVKLFIQCKEDEERKGLATAYIEKGKANLHGAQNLASYTMWLVFGLLKKSDNNKQIAI